MDSGTLGARTSGHGRPTRSVCLAVRSRKCEGFRPSFEIFGLRRVTRGSIRFVEGCTITHRTGFSLSFFGKPPTQDLPEGRSLGTSQIADPSNEDYDFKLGRRFHVNTTDLHKYLVIRYLRTLRHLHLNEVSGGDRRRDLRWSGTTRNHDVT